jgi:hypothetical protein
VKLCILLYTVILQFYSVPSLCVILYLIHMKFLIVILHLYSVFILHFVYWISCFRYADPIWPQSPAPCGRLTSSVLKHCSSCGSQGSADDVVWYDIFVNCSWVDTRWLVVTLIVVRFPQGTRECSSFRIICTASGAHTASFSMGESTLPTRSFSSWVISVRCAAVRSFPLYV